MHECPDCGQACSCDIEDTWNEAAADDCVHVCDDDHDDGWDDEDDDDVGECPHGIPEDVVCTACLEEDAEKDDDDD
jgi:hypothetical protein